jgi:hypothetical protein
MREVAEKLVSLEQRLADEKGPFAFFALVKAETEPERWDLVVSAPWIAADTKSGIKYIIEELNKTLSLRETALIPRVVALREEDPFLGWNRMLYQGRGVPAEMTGNIINGILLPDSYIITSQDVSEATGTPQPAAEGADTP